MMEAAAARSPDYVAAFRAEIEAHGLRPQKVVPDGQRQRCPVEGKPGARDGAYGLYPDNPPSGWWRNWRTGEQGTWTAKWDQPLTLAERQRFSEQMEALRREREEEQAQEWERAAKRAATVLNQAEPCHAHPYLERKGVKPCPRLVVDTDGKLLVPVLDPDGKPQSLQTIAPDGEKRFMPCGKMAGGYFPIKGDTTSPLLVCEGLATGLSIHEATSATVLVAFTAGNLEGVAQIARKRYPERVITICGDDDHKTEGNPGLKNATEAARAVRGKIAMPRFSNDHGAGSDFNDLHQSEGLDVVRAQVEAAKEPAQDVIWPQVVPFETHHAPPLPVEVFPEWGRDFTQAAAEHLQVAPCMVMANVLGAVAMATAGKMVIEVKQGYQEPLNLYLLAPAPPAERKTAAQILALKPLYEWEAERAQAMRDEINRAISERKSQEAVITGRRNRLTKAKPDERECLIREIVDLEAKLPEIPYPPRLLADDITPEATAVLMAHHGERLGIASCEGGIFDILAGRYSGGIANLDLVLKAHSGEHLRVDRKSGPPVLMSAPALTMCLSPQPEVLTGLVSKPGFRGRGLLGRFAYILPQSLLGLRSVDTLPMKDRVVRAYGEALFRLLELPWSMGVNGEPISYVLRFDQAAYRAWTEFANAIEPELADGRRFETVRDWAGKLPGLAARLAGNLHAMEHLEQAPYRKVQVATMNSALELASALVGHALAAFGMMGADPDIEAAKHALAWIRREGRERFTLRDCHRGVIGRYPKVQQVQTALQVLEDHGYIQPELTSKPTGPGRPPSPEYMVNPVVFEVA